MACAPLSRRRLLARLGTLGLSAALGAAVTACGGSKIYVDPQKMVRDFLGQAQQATGAAPVPKLLRWVTPIQSLRVPAADVGTPTSLATPTPLPSPTPGTATVRQLGWAAMLNPWQDSHPSITLVHQVVADERLTEVQLALTASDEAGDLAYTNWGQTLGAAGALDPLDVSALSRKIEPVAFEPQSDGDQVYALPIFLSALGLYLNNTRLKAGGVDPGAPPRDWSSFEATARALTNRSASLFGADVFGSGSPQSGEMRYAPFLWSAGGSFFNNAGDTALWNERTGLDALIYLARLSQNYASPDSAVASDQTLIQNWLVGRTASLLAGPELTTDAEARELDYSVQSIPAFIQGQASSLVTSEGSIGVFAKSKHKDWAIDFARYLAGKDAQIAGLTQLRLLPANIEAGDTAPVFQKNVKLAQFLRILREDDVHPFPMPRSHAPEVAEIFRAYLGVALQGLATPLVAWNKSAAEATALLKAVGTPTAGPKGTPST
jgi:ABC-type glycerol-3-phosphate transport system substrate-binding protein